MGVRFQMQMCIVGKFWFTCVHIHCDRCCSVNSVVFCYLLLLYKQSKIEAGAAWFNAVQGEVFNLSECIKMCNHPLVETLYALVVENCLVFTFSRFWKLRKEPVHPPKLNEVLVLEFQFYTVVSCLFCLIFYLHPR